jgi:signal transduction histidine kinase
MLKTFYAWLTRIDSTDREIVRRGVLFVQVCGLMVLSGLMIYPATIIHWGTPLFWVQVGLATFLELIMALSIGFARAGRVTVGAWICSLGIIGVLTWGNITIGQFSNALWHYLACVVIAGFVMRPRNVWLVTGAVITGVSLSLLFTEMTLADNARQLISFGLLLMFVSLLTFMHSRVMSKSMAELEDSNRNLRRTNEELDAARQKAEAASEAKSRLLDRVSHGLRTPLHTIIGYTELLEEELRFEDDVDAESLLQDIDKIHFASGGLLLSIENLLTFSELDASGDAIDVSSFDAAQLANELADKYRAFVDLHGSSLELSLDDASITVQTDREKLARILANLLSNAIKFTDHGEISLGVEVIEDNVAFTVRDSGKGMTGEQLRELYDALDTSHVGSKHAYDGAGIGLALCRQLARALDGDLVIESVLDKGTTATLTVARTLEVRAER